MRILGLNCFGHDSAVCVIDTTSRDVFAMSTERVTRIKHDAGDVAPILAAYDLRPIHQASQGYASMADNYGPDFYNEIRRQQAYRRIFDVHEVGGGRTGRRRTFRFLLRALVSRPMDAFRYVHQRLSPSGTPAHRDLREQVSRTLRENGLDGIPVSLWDHHLCHAASAYHFSPLAGRLAVVLTLDLYGDGHSSKVFLFHQRTHTLLGASRSSATAASLGGIYTNFTEALGLAPNSDEGKVEALAAYGEADPDLTSALSACVQVSAEGFAFDATLALPFDDIATLRREVIRIGDRNFAATVQRWLEDVVVQHLNLVHQRLGMPGLDVLCLAGGVCANVIMTLGIFERTPFKKIHVFPAMGDEGVAAGSAVLAALDLGEDISWLGEKPLPYFGNMVTRSDAEIAIARNPAIRADALDGEWQELAADAIAKGRIIGLVQGRMEFGPRALGNRSILANPALADVRDRLNASIKRRPWYQPLCPSILEEERYRLFEKSLPHKQMAIAFRLREEFRSALPSATHVDGTARAQFVEEADNPEYYRLLKAVQKRTGFGVVINTSLNLHGRTIVRTADDAIDDFLACNMDELFLAGFRVTRRS